MIRNLIRYAALVALVGLGACKDALVVPNQVSGDTKKVLGTPTDAENLIASYYRRWHSGLYGSTTDFEGMANVQSMMNYSSLANNCQNGRLPFSGAQNSNALGNVCSGEQFRLYSIMGEVERVASNLLTQMDLNLADSKTGISLSLTPTPATDARNLRARSFAEFLRGISLGYVAMFYDSAGIVSPTMGASPADCVPDPITAVCVGALRGYKEVFDSSMAAFQRAIDYAQPAAAITGTGGFPIPTTWLPTPASNTAAQFVQVIRTYRARIRANVARTPAERAAADWTAIVADAAAGITTDHNLITSTTNGPGNSWRDQYEAFTTWHQMPPFFIGMADNSGSYAGWIATPVGDRGAGSTGFFMVTPDQRFPQGATRAAQNSDFAISSCATAATPCKRYFTNRSAGADQFSGAGWGWSNYDFVRFHSWDLRGDAGSARNGATVFFTLSELNLLRAEGLYRQGNYAAAAALINISRTTGTVGTPAQNPNYAIGGGLPAITAFDAVTPVPGGANCVPKAPGFGVPAGDFTKVGCGNMWEALKYEKRIETAYTSYAPWYLDNRGWGDLAKDTPLFWAVPYQDYLARGKQQATLYGAGPGVGNAPGSVAALSTYGW